IHTWQDLLGSCHMSELEKKEGWPDAGKANMVLRSDAAYELGGANAGTFAIGSSVMTEDESLVPEDGIFLVGPDLNEISGDCSYARLAVVLVDGNEMGEGDKLYTSIRDISYARYHVEPEGFMMRVSSSDRRESVRVSRDAVSRGISFSHVGDMMIRAFHERKHVRRVRLYFITDPAFDFKGLSESVKKAGDITAAIDHIFKDIQMDCNACNLKQVCDEVEGLKELHFGQSALSSKA
ncbi:MAG: carbon monoxide dehydrogenase, partial [Lachnospiraceae bacterium]|nr:carbon monoxide dehydrogenase [Lachnospiraceae bacterium]